MHEIHIDTVQQFNERYGFETLHPLKRPGGQREKNTQRKAATKGLFPICVFALLYVCFAFSQG